MRAGPVSGGDGSAGNGRRIDFILKDTVIEL